MAYVNSQQPRIDAWIQPGCRADIAVVSTESWPVDTVVTIGVADAAGVIAVPLLTITPDLATVTATVALTGVQVAALAVACPPPYGVVDWQWRTGAGSPLGVGSLHWDLTGARTTQTVTVQLGPRGVSVVGVEIDADPESETLGHLLTTMSDAAVIDAGDLTPVADALAVEAQASADAAAGSASTATTQAGLAATAKTNAESARDAAAASASAAADSASTASTQAGLATTQAGNASGSASAASGSASTATTQAGIATAAAAALAGAGTGMVVHTAAGNNYAGRTLQGTVNRVTVTNGDGVSGNPTLTGPQDIHTGATPTFAGAKLPVLTNLITNGDFSNGTTGWARAGATIAAASNTLTVTGDGTSATPGATQTLSVTQARRYYVAAQVKVTNAACSEITAAIGTVSTTLVVSPINGTIYMASGIITAAATGSTTLGISATYADTATANGKVLTVKYAAMLDLTAIFGVGTEPTKSEMDRIMSYFSNSWFDGTADITPLIKALASRHEAGMGSRNLVTNGDFSNGTTGWTGISGGWSVSNGALVGTATATEQAYTSPGKATLPAGRVFNLRMSITAYTSGSAEIHFGGEVVGAPRSATGTYSVNVTSTATTNGNVVIAGIAGSPFTGSISRVAVLDLTTIFGAGNEPTAYEMDSMMAMHPNSWFDGYADPAVWLRWMASQRTRKGVGSPEGVVTAPAGTEYIDTAITAGAAKWLKLSGTGNAGWIVTVADTGRRAITMTGGYTGSLQVSRTNAEVTIRLDAVGSGGASATTHTLATLPVGLRPAATMTWLTADGTTLARVTLTSAGVLSVVLASSGTLTSVSQTTTCVSSDAWFAAPPGSAA